MSKTTLKLIGLIVLSFFLSIYFYPQMPEQMAAHWNFQGEVNGYMSKFWGLFFMPLVTLCITVMFFLIPRIDPMKENIETFRKYYDEFNILLILFLVAVHLYVILWNSGIIISSSVVFPVGIGLIFYFIGVLTEHVERNWFIGIRTPWALSSDRVWKKTNQIGGKLFKIAGIIAILGVLFPEYIIYFILVPALIIVGFVFVYSYVEYQKELKEMESQIKT
ncbi:MAG TPA: SdpI family protein [Methanosarcina sp.]|jgi:uncharacterized membrane protein